MRARILCKPICLGCGSPSTLLLCPQELRTATLLDYGKPTGSGEGPSAMARLVGVPCGIAVEQVLDGVINKPGVLAPYSMDIVAPLLKAVEAEGVGMKETVEALV